MKATRCGRRQIYSDPVDYPDHGRAMTPTVSRLASGWERAATLLGLDIIAPFVSKRGWPELVRVWAAGGAQHVALAAGLWQDPAAWGIVLADLARHVSRAYEQTQGVSQVDVLKRIREALDAEWGHPTDEQSGKVT